jgi:hypothetical protein
MYSADNQGTRLCKAEALRIIDGIRDQVVASGQYTSDYKISAWSTNFILHALPGNCLLEHGITTVSILVGTDRMGNRFHLGEIDDERRPETYEIALLGPRGRMVDEHMWFDDVYSIARSDTVYDEIIAILNCFATGQKLPTE